MLDSPAILVDCISLHHRYRGWLPTHGVRLSDELSNTRSNLIVLRDVQITAAGNNTPTLECSEITLLKERLLIAIPLEGHDTHGAQRLNKFQKKDRHGIVAVLPGHILSGVIHIPKRTGSWSTLCDSGVLPPFFGLTDVSIHSAVFRLAPQSCPLAIVQRDAVEAFELVTAALGETTPAETLAN